MSAIRRSSGTFSGALLVIFLLLLVDDARAQDSPLFETRAVWFATVLRDGNWPESPNDSAAKQEADLRERIRTAAALGINAFVFQAVSRGDAMYESDRLPWSYNLGNAGEDPGYDPLAVAIDEAHKLGMELHAWVNVYRIGDTQTKSRYDGVTDPQHVAFAHPDWVKERDGELWIDPASDEAREWLVDNLMEIVENYDVDAVHYDFIRYPRGGFQDDLETCRTDTDSDCPDLYQWRRDNVTQFVEEAYDRVYDIKPWVEVGATPIGNYHDQYDWSGMSAYHEVYQASREWTGSTDYLAPQVYWGLGDTGGGPHFEVLAEEWVDDSNVPVFVGIAAYGPARTESSFPADQLDDQIQVTRDVGAAGHIFFRYDHFIDYIEHIEPMYSNPALTTPMTHRLVIQAPSVPDNLTIQQVGSSTVQLSWDASQGSASDPLHAYAIFRSEGGPPDLTSADDLFAIVGATTYSEGFEEPPTEDVYYSVAAVSKLGELSDAGNVVSTEAVNLTIEGEQPGGGFQLLSIYPNPTPGRATAVMEVDQPGPVTVRVYDALGRLAVEAYNGLLTTGRHEIELNLGRQSAGTYIVEVRNDGSYVTRQLVRI